MSVKIALISLGCPKNQVDSERMLALLENAGMELVQEPAGADAAILNTCGFIESAAQEALSEIFALSSLKKQGLLKKIIVTGCLPERYKDDFLSELPEVDFVLGTGSYHKIVEAVADALKGRRQACFDDVNLSPLEGRRTLLSSPHTAYLKIAEGCDNRCAYCVIPKLRGRYRSRPEEDVFREAEALVQNGTRELILVAQDLTRYGLDLYGKRRLSALLERLCAISGVEWLRLHYLYPDEIDDRLIETVVKNDKIVNYFDIPIQHINDKILKSMNRRGGRALIEALFAKIRQQVPDSVIRTSVIVGLPGETDLEFTELCEFLKAARLPRAGVFAYSAEEGSAAAAMDSQVDDETKARRLELLQNIQYAVMEEYNERQKGRILKVLCEGYDGGSKRYFGRTFADSPDIDAKVYFSSEWAVPTGAFAKVHITGAVDSDLTGETKAQDGEHIS